MSCKAQLPLCKKKEKKMKKKEHVFEKLVFTK